MVVISNSFPRIKTCYSPNWGVKNCCALFFKVCSPVCWSAALVKKTAPKLSFITTPPSLHLLHFFPVFFFTLWFVSTSSPQLTLSSSHQTLVATYSFSLLRIKKELFYFTNEFPPIKVNRTSRSNVWLKLLILEQSIKKLIRSVSKKLGNRFTILIGLRVGVKQSGTCKSCRCFIIFGSNSLHFYSKFYRVQGIMRACAI